MAKRRSLRYFSDNACFLLNSLLHNCFPMFVFCAIIYCRVVSCMMFSVRLFPVRQFPACVSCSVVLLQFYPGQICSIPERSLYFCYITLHYNNLFSKIISTILSTIYHIFYIIRKKKLFARQLWPPGQFSFKDDIHTCFSSSPPFPAHRQSPPKHYNQDFS